MTCGLGSEISSVKQLLTADGDSFNINELANSLNAEFSAKSGIIDSTKRQAGIGADKIINHTSTCMNVGSR